MVKQSNRALRISSEIKKEVSFILQKLIQDPRINSIITISNVELSRDFSHATIFIIFIENNNKKNIENILKILKRASSYIRKILSQRMRLKKTPKIIFNNDCFFSKAIKISKMIDRL